MPDGQWHCCYRCRWEWRGLCSPAWFALKPNTSSSQWTRDSGLFWKCKEKMRYRETWVQRSEHTVHYSCVKKWFCSQTQTQKHKAVLILNISTSTHHNVWEWGIVMNLVYDLLDTQIQSIHSYLRTSRGQCTCGISAKWANAQTHTIQLHAHPACWTHLRKHVSSLIPTWTV